jgi:tetratricopeptide (TPR) repeat protein
MNFFKNRLQLKSILFLSKNDKKKAMKFSPLCDPAGIRTQDPYIKSVLLYQLSYGISKDSICCFESDPAGIRTQDPYIKSVLLYQLSYGIIYRLLQMRMQNYVIYFRLQNLVAKFILLFFLFFSQCPDSKAQNDIASEADSLFSARKYTEAAIVYENIISDNAVSRENIFLKLAFIYENAGDYPRAIYELNNYYNLNPSDEVFEKMHKMALENKFGGYERSDLNFLLMLYQQFYLYILYFFIAIGVLIFIIMFNQNRKNLEVSKKHKILAGLYLLFLLLIINVPSNYQAAIVNKKSYIRAEPTSASPIIGFISEGNKINIFGEDEKWLKVFWKKKLVYIHKNDTWVLVN